MPAPRKIDEELLGVAVDVLAQDGSLRAAADAIGFHRTSLQRRIDADPILRRKIEETRRREQRRLKKEAQREARKARLAHGQTSDMAPEHRSPVSRVDADGEP